MYMHVSCVQLKNFIKRASFDPVIDENYFARAQEKDKDDILPDPTAKYILAFYAIGFILALVITIILLLIYVNTKRWDMKLKRTAETTKANKYTKSKIFSITATTSVINLYVLILDGFATYTIENETVTIDEHYVHALPWVVMGIDIAGALFWIIFWMLSFCSWIYEVYCYTPGKCTCNNKEYMCLALSTLGPILSIMIHLPYIAIAYLNDASYATSIFIYYTITVFVLFGVLDLTYGTCQGAIIKAKLNKDGKQPRKQEQDLFCCCPKDERRIRGLCCFVIPTFAFLILTLVGLITALLTVIPISKSFSDAPNRLLGFYQTAIVLIGVYLLYRTFFKKKPSLASVVKNREEYIPTKTTKSDADWGLLSKDDKVAEFYTRFVDIVANYSIAPPSPHPAPTCPLQSKGAGTGPQEEKTISVS